MSSGSKKRRPVVAVVVILVVIVLPVLAFFVVPVSILSYDESHQIVRSCAVERAIVEDTSSKSLKGAGASGEQVVVHTSDCGTILLQRGINRQNAREVAKRLSAASSAQFRLGALTYQLRGLLGTVGIAPAAYGYRVR